MQFSHTQTHCILEYSANKLNQHTIYFLSDSVFLTFHRFLFAWRLSSQTGIDPELPSWTCAPRAAQCKHCSSPSPLTPITVTLSVTLYPHIQGHSCWPFQSALNNADKIRIPHDKIHRRHLFTVKVKRYNLSNELPFCPRFYNWQVFVSVFGEIQ